MGATGSAFFGAPNVDDPTNDIVVDLAPPALADCPDLDVLFADIWLETPGDVFIEYIRGVENPGDVYIFDNNVIDAGGLSGLVSGECTVLPVSGDSYCTISFQFPEGTITVQGAFFRVMSITGGTGCFSGISGLVQGDTAPGAGSVDFFLQYTFTVDGVADVPLTCNNRIFDFPWYESGEDQFLDYDRNNVISQGDMFVFDQHAVIITALSIQATAAGRCVTIEQVTTANNSFCSIVFAFDDGELVVQGFFEEMTIIAGSGCFEGVTGTVQVSSSGNFFEYVFLIGD